jgi:hypothetical protein
MALTLTDLQTIESNLLKAIGNPTLSVAYDHFRREMRPVSDLQKSLDQVRSEMAALTKTASSAPRVRRNLPSAICDL